MTEREEYVLGYRQAEQARLQQQALQLADESAWMFDQIGLAPGAHAVEIGCGPRGCLELLSNRVGAAGRVVGVERSEDAVSLAREFAEQRGLQNVEVLHSDARLTGLPRDSVDLVTARLVLVNIPEPNEVISEAVALVRPGGWVAFHEADYISHICDPPLRAWTTLLDLLLAYSKKHGIDPFIGRKVPRLLREAGLINIQVNPLIHVYPPGHPRRNILPDFAENLRERMLAEKLVSDRQFNDLKTELQRHLDNPGTLVVSHLFVQAWGRKPDGSTAV